MTSTSRTKLPLRILVALACAGLAALVPARAFGSGGTLPGGTPGSVTGASSGGGTYACYSNTSLTTTNPSGGSSFTDLLEWPIAANGVKNTSLFAAPTPNWIVKVPSATPPVGSNTNEIPTCSYDRWPTQVEHLQTSTASLCPTGFDVWRFYGTANDAGTSYGSLGMTVSHVAIVNTNCNLSNSPSVDVIVPNPADTSTSATPPSTFAQAGSSAATAREYPYYTGPSGTSGYGGTVWYSPLKNPTTYQDFKVSGASCSSIYASYSSTANADVTVANGVFATVLNTPNPSTWGSPLSPYQTFAKNFVANSARLSANPGYMGWLSLFPNQYGLVDQLMNLNSGLGPASLPALFIKSGSTYTPRTDPMSPGSSQFDNSSADWTTTWTNLRAAYASSNVPACASPYQFLKPSTNTTNQVVYGACEMPTGRLAYGETSPQFNKTFPIYKAGSTNQYLPFKAGTRVDYANGTNWYATAAKIWRTMIAAETGNRTATYQVGGSPSPACFAGATPGSGIPGPATPLSNVIVAAPTVTAGSTTNPNLVTVSLGGYSCTTCNNASTQGPYGLTATVTITLAAPSSSSAYFKVFDPSTSSWQNANNSTHPAAGVPSSICSSQGACDWYDYTQKISCPTTQTTASCLASIANTHFTIPVAFVGTPTSFVAVHTASTASISICTGGSSTCGTQSTARWTPGTTQAGRTATGILVFGPNH